MSYTEIRKPVERWTAEGRRAAIATLVRVHGSAPRDPGARFAVDEDGRVAGSVSAGCVESDLAGLLATSIETGQAAVASYGISDEMALEVGLSCGGTIEVLLAPYDPDDPVSGELAAAVDDGRPTVLFTRLDDPATGRTMLASDTGPLVGSLGSAVLDAGAVEAARPLFDFGGARVVALTPGTGPERVEVFAEAFRRPPGIAIVGGGPIAEILCDFATRTGYEVSVIDPRAAFAEESRFQSARQILHIWPDEAFQEIDLDRSVAVVVLTHDQKIDVPALAGALDAGCVYIGLLGGRRTQIGRREALAASGHSEEALARIRGPIGLPIGAATPAEIAVSILAEITAVRRGA